MKKKIFCAVIILNISLFITYLPKYNQWEKLNKNILNSGAKIEEIEVEGHGSFHTNRNLNDIAVQLYKATGFKDKLNQSCEKDEVILSDSRITLKVKSLPEENLNYASFALSQYIEVKNINNIRDSICKGFSIYNIEPTFSYLFKGKYLKKMTIAQMKNKASEILLLCGGKNISGIEDRNLVSYTGFTSSIHEKINVLNNSINLNIALRCDKRKGDTYLWVGCPIIAIEY